MRSERGGRLSVPRRTSVRRPHSMHSTIDTQKVLQPAPPSPDCSRCMPQSVPAPVRPSHSGRTIRAARTAGPCERGSDWLPALSSLSAIGANAWAVAVAESTHARDCSLLRKRANRRVPFGHRERAPLLLGSPLPGASKTLAPGGWYPNSGPSTQRLCLRRACPEVDIALWVGFRADAKSRRARRLPDRCGAGASSTYSWNKCAMAGEIFSGAARRTEVRRGTLKRAPLGTGNKVQQGRGQERE